MARFPSFHNPANTWYSKGLLIALGYALVLAAFAGCSTAPQPEPTTVKNTVEPADPAKTIVWGKADLEPTEAINEWQPTVDYLASRLSGMGINAGEMKIARDSKTLGQWMAAGEVDLVRDSFYPAMIVSERSGAVPLAVRSKGKPPKHAVFFVRAEADVESLSDLVGRNIAFAEADSTSGFMLPLVHLRQKGFEASEQPNPEAEVNPDEIGYVFAGDDDVVATWVFEGRVIAGAVDNRTFEEFEAENPGKLRALSETESISADNIVLIREDMDPEVASVIKGVLLDMKNTEEGRSILKSTGTLSFDEFAREAAADWDKAREQYLIIRD